MKIKKALAILCLSCGCLDVWGIKIGKINIDPYTNDAEIKMDALNSASIGAAPDGITLDMEIYGEIIDSNGRTKWIKDSGSYAGMKAYHVDRNNPRIKLRWICADPENPFPSKRFKVVLTERDNGKKLEKVFEISNPNI